MDALDEENLSEDEESMPISGIGIDLNVDIDSINRMGTNYRDSEMARVESLTNEQCRQLNILFDRPIRSETIFVLKSMLNSADAKEINGIFQLFIKCLSRMNKSSNTKSPEILASLGIYLSIILRHEPDLNLYVDGEHFLTVGLKCYLPYMNMYITFFLMATIIKYVNLEGPYLETPGYAYNTKRSSKGSPDNLSSNSRKSSNPGDLNSSIPNEEDLLKLEINRLRDQVGASVNYDNLFHSNNRSSTNNSPNQSPNSTHPLNQITTQEELSKRRSPEKSTSGRVPSPKPESVIDKIISICSITSPERRVLNELKRIYTSPAAFILVRLGLKDQKQELALFLDMPELLNTGLSEEDIQKAIFMHSNKILDTVIGFRPHHFNRAIECLNYSIAKKTSHMSDWVSAKTLDDFTYICKELKHAICLELLLLVIRKNIVLCSHHIKRLPVAWREVVLQQYTKPRWKVAWRDFKHYVLSCRPNNAEEDQDVVDIHKGLCHGDSPILATLEYYRLNLCLGEDYHQLIQCLENLEQKLVTPDALEAFVETTKTMNKSYYLLQVSNYADVFAKNKVVFANSEDMLGQDIFELSRNFVVPCRESSHISSPQKVTRTSPEKHQREHGDKIFLLDYGTFKSLTENRVNPYNRNPLSETLAEEIVSMFQFYNTLGLANECVTISEFAKELIGGREVISPCHCRKDYMTKLIRVLRHYGVQEESFEWINLADICFKFSLMSMVFQAEDVPQLCMKLYTAIKKAAECEKEELKRIIASSILIYSKYQGAAFVVNM